MRQCESECSDELKLQAEFGLGVAFLAQQRISDANDHLLKSYSISSQIGDTRFQLENLLRLAKLALLQRNHEIAKEYLGRVEAISERRVIVRF